MEFGLLSFIKMSPFIPLVIVFVMIWSDVDPLSVLNQLHNSKMPTFRVLLIAVRLAIFTQAGSELLKSICCLATLASILLAASIQIMARCRKVLRNAWTAPINVIKLYKELQRWNIMCNQNFHSLGIWAFYTYTSSYV